MKQKQILVYVQSLIIIPFLTTTLNFGSLIGVTPADAQGLMSSLKEESLIDASQIKKAELINEYFGSRDLPLAGHGMKLVEAAEKNGLDWRLIAAIAMRESTGYKHACTSASGANNGFGWNSCKSGFATVDIAIEEVAAHLGGNNERTDQYYAGKSTEQILKTYNPDEFMPGYTKQVMKIMSTIGPEVVII